MTGKLDQLIGLFNARSMDLPDGLFDRKTQFRLNGAPFETLLGRPADDPLVLMLARGPAGFRFAVKALQHAVPDAAIERGNIETAGDSPGLTVAFWLSGHLRGVGDRFDTVVAVRLECAEGGGLEVADATIDPAALERLRAAGLLP